MIYICSLILVLIKRKIICIRPLAANTASKYREAISPLLTPLCRATIAPCTLWDVSRVHYVHKPILINLEASIKSICQSIWNTYILIWNFTKPLPIYVKYGNHRSCGTVFHFTLFPCILITLKSFDLINKYWIWW